MATSRPLAMGTCISPVKHPMSTPTAAGLTASFIAITLPTVAPFP